MEEENHKKYKVYIRETSSYFVYNKENMDNNCFIKGRTLIRQLSNDSQKLPYRRPTLKSLQEKISEINLMIELSNTNKQYQEIKDELVLEIAEIDMKLEETQEKIATLNKMAEVLINLKSEDEIGRKLAKYDFDQMNMTESIMLDRLNTDILNPNHSYLSQLDVTYKTPDLMSHFLPPHEVSFTFCCSSIVFPR
ncbi:truncated MobA family endonuclease relaxase [Streptococcus pneumoniae]|nr:truncated MobA family endonuclease relaxase [Streptococcus pneumoniae]